MVTYRMNPLAWPVGTRFEVVCDGCGSTDMNDVGFAAMHANRGWTRCCSTMAHWAERRPDTAPATERPADGNLGGNQSPLTAATGPRILDTPTTTKEDQ